MQARKDALKLLGGTAIALAMGAGPALAQADDTYCTFTDVENYDEIFERFDRLDVDDDNRITLSEYEACLDAFDITGAEREQYVTEFQELDAEEDDVLVTAEVEAIVLEEDTAVVTEVPDDEPPARGEEDGALTAEVVSLAEWRYDDLYTEGISAEEWIDEGEIYSVGGEEIGDLEDVIVGQDGYILAIIAEVGGFWDMGDTHIAVPWEEVAVNGFNIEIPVTEENIEEYDIFDREFLTADTVVNQTVGGVDDAALGGGAYRLSELIGDYARLRGEGDTPMNYGYVNDVIIRGDQVAAVVVNPRTGYGVGGYYAYPYWGYGYAPGSRYYDMPYTEAEIGDVEPLEYERF